MLASKLNVHVPPGFTSVTPYVTVDDPDRLVDFAKAAFAAEEMKDQRALGPDGKVMHTAFRVEGCVIEAGRASAEWKAMPVAIHLYVRDVDATYIHALKAGGESLHAVREMEYDERACAVRDPCGNHWYIATHTVRPEKKR